MAHTPNARTKIKAGMDMQQTSAAIKENPEYSPVALDEAGLRQAANDLGLCQRALSLEGKPIDQYTNILSMGNRRHYGPLVEQGRAKEQAAARQQAPVAKKDDVALPTYPLSGERTHNASLNNAEQKIAVSPTKADPGMKSSGPSAPAGKFMLSTVWKSTGPSGIA